MVPSLYLLSDDDAANLRRYAEGGGTPVVSYLSGVADPYGRVRTGGHPGALRDLRVGVEEFRPLEAPVTLSNGDTGTVWSELVRLRGVEAVAAYPDGSPAITRHGARGTSRPGSPTTAPPGCSACLRTARCSTVRCSTVRRSAVLRCRARPRAA